MPAPHRDRWILLIGVTKAIKSASLVVLAALAFSLSRGDSAVELRHWAFTLGIDPGSHVMRIAIEHANVWGDEKLRLLAAGMIVYAALFAIEATGLLLQKRWGEYVTIVITGSFIPIEVYETVLHPHVPRAVTIVLNVAAVAYLVHRVRAKHLPLRYAPSCGKDAPPA